MKIKNKRKFAGQRKIVNADQFLICTLIAAALFSFACGNRSSENTNAAATPAVAENKRASFENDLQTMKTANLQYVFAFRRKDGGAVDAEDKKFLRANLPATNRVILADEDKAVIVGSNYKFPPESLNVLQTRFNVEDYSTAEQTK